MQQEQTIICRCEEVTLEELLMTATAHQCSPRELKLRTRAGMGCCGGRTCRSLIDAIIRQVTGAKPSHQASLSYQPPVRPITFGLLDVAEPGSPYTGPLADEDDKRACSPSPSSVSGGGRG